MAIINDHFIFETVTGQIGSQLVIRRRKGQVVVSKYPAKRRFLSEAQQRQVDRFREATFYAKSALKDEELRRIYAERARKAGGCMSASNVAIADYLHAPVIRDVDLRGYRGGLLDEIRVSAADDFLVDSVMIEILRSDGSLLEVGMAAFSTGGAGWVYYAQSVNDEPEGCRVVVSVSDLPGNVARQEYVLDGSGLMFGKRFF